MRRGASGGREDGSADGVDTRDAILDAVLTVLARDGVSGVSMRAVARQAGVALGLINYHFDTKTSLIAAALTRVGDSDADIVAADGGPDPAERLRDALHRAVDRDFLRADYLSLRLQLWSLAGVDPVFARINREAQMRYRTGLADLIATARPGLAADDVARRAADIVVVQNGIWLTSILIQDDAALERGIAHTEHLAFA